MFLTVKESKGCENYKAVVILSASSRTIDSLSSSGCPQIKCVWQHLAAKSIHGDITTHSLVPSFTKKGFHNRIYFLLKIGGDWRHPMKRKKQLNIPQQL